MHLLRRLSWLIPLASLLSTGCQDDRLVSPLKPPGSPLANVDASTATMTVAITFGDVALSDQHVDFAASCPFALYRDPTPEAPYGQYVTSICPGSPVVLTGQAVGTHTYRLRFNGPSSGTGVNANLASEVTTTLVAGESFTQNFELSGAMALIKGVMTVNGAAPDNGYLACTSANNYLSACVRPDPVTGAFALVDLAGDRSLGIRGMTTTVAAATSTYTAMAGATVDVGTIAVSAGGVTFDLQYGGTPLRDQGIRFAQYCFGTLYMDPTASGGSPAQSLCSDPTTYDALPAGTHLFDLRFYPGHGTDYQPSVGQVSTTVVAGQTIHAAIELSGGMGLLTGTLRDGGSVPAEGTYVVCTTSLGANGPCVAPDATTGVFKLLDVSGDRTASVRRISDYSGGQPLTYAIATGETTDLGTVNIAATSVTLEPRYKDLLLKDIGVSYEQYCEFVLYRDPTPTNTYGTYVNSLCPHNTDEKITLTGLDEGTHTLQLRYAGPGSTSMSSQPLVSSVTVSVVSGTPITRTLELSGTMGLVSGELTVNGLAPGDGYLLCTGSFNYYYPCVGADPVSGAFKLLDIAGARLGIVRTYSTYAPTSSFGYTVVAGETTIVGTTTGGVAGTTDVGTHVSVTPVDAASGSSPATLVFAQVNGAGLTTVTTSPTGPNAPPKTKLGRPAFYYNIATSATYTGTISLCINYSSTTFSNPAKAQLLHGDGAGGWTDITTSNDLVNHVICGETTSLSPYVIVEPANSAPVAALNGPYTGGEGSGIEFDGTGSSDPDGDALTYAWNFGDGGTSTVAKPSHTYADNGTYTVTLTVTDAGQLQSSTSSSVVVSNAAPSVRAGSDATIVSGDTYSFSGSFTDPGASDAPWTTELSFGEGAAVTGTSSDRSTPITGTHQYLKAGVYVVQLKVSDKDGGSGTGTSSVRVARLQAALSFFPFLSTLPQAPAIYDPTSPQRSTPVVVALLGTASLQVVDPITRAPRVDVASLRLGRTPVAMLLGRYVMTATDVNSDGQLDLVLTFATDKLVANGDLSSTITGPQAVTLTGDHLDGRQFSGQGTVTVRLKSTIAADR